METLNDNEQINHLVMALQEGSTDAFSKLYDMYVQPLFYFGTNFTTDHELLKDCIQDVFVKIYLKSRELKDIKNFKAYLYISLKNKLYDEMRKLSMMSEAELEELNPIAEGGTVEEVYVENETKMNKSHLVTSLMEHLSPRQRKAIQLYYIDGREYEEICDILQMNYQSVRNLVYRSMQKLREYALPC